MVFGCFGCSFCVPQIELIKRIYGLPGEVKSLDRVNSNNYVLTTIGTVSLTLRNHSFLAGKKKAMGLLVYLLLNERAVIGRDAAANLLWPDVEEQQAKSSLRQLLSAMKRELGEVSPITVTREDISVQPERFDIDVSPFLVENNIDTLTDHSNILADLSTQILFGYDDVSGLFSDWLSSYRKDIDNRLKESILNAVKAGEHSDSDRKRLISALLKIDPFDEAATRMAMRTASERGDISEALTYYKDLYDLLDLEFGMEPSASTQDLLVKIKLGQDVEPNYSVVSRKNDGAIASQAKIDINYRPTIAVLPVRSLGPDDAPEFFTIGSVDEITSHLATTTHLRVISANSTRNLQVATDNLNSLVQHMDIDYLVVSTVRRSGNRLKFSVQLENMRVSDVEWARVYDLYFDEIFDVQAELSREIAAYLSPTIKKAELAKIGNKTPENLPAYLLSIKAQSLMGRLDMESFKEAGNLLRQAVGQSPDFGLPYILLCEWFSLRIGQGYSLDENSDRLELENFLKIAFQSKQVNGRAYAMYAHNISIVNRQFDEAHELVGKAHTISPGDADTLSWLTPTISFLDDPEKGVMWGSESLSLSPESHYNYRQNHFLSIAHFIRGDFEKSHLYGMAAYDLSQKHTSNLRMTAAALAASGKIQLARELASKAIAIDPGFTIGALKARLPFKNEDIANLYIDCLRRVGIPV